MESVAGIEVLEGDITRLEVDAVVNAANEHLEHGGGVAAAISRAGGPTIQAESDEWVRRHGPLRPGQAAVTGAGAMPARWVIHVVGPRYRPDQDNETLLGRAVIAALEAAAEHGARSIALPAISAGIFGYPRTEATRVIARTVADWLSRNPGVVDRVVLVGYDQATADDFRAAVAEVEGTDGHPPAVG